MKKPNIIKLEKQGFCYGVRRAIKMVLELEDLIEEMEESQEYYIDWKREVKMTINFDEYKDDENEITKVFAISRDQWADLNRQLLDKQI